MPRSILFVGDNLAPHMARLAAAVARRGYRVFVWDGDECLQQIPDRPPEVHDGEPLRHTGEAVSRYPVST